MTDYFPQITPVQISVYNNDIVVQVDNMVMNKANNKDKLIFDQRSSSSALEKLKLTGDLHFNFYNQ